MRLESYSITGISPCLALPRMNDMDMVELSFLWGDLCEFPFTCVRVRIRSNLKLNNSTFY